MAASVARTAVCPTACVQPTTTPVVPSATFIDVFICWGVVLQPVNVFIQLHRHPTGRTHRVVNDEVC